MKDQPTKGEVIAKEKMDNIHEEALALKAVAEASTPVQEENNGVKSEELTATEIYQVAPGGIFKPGNPGGGRPKGQKNYTTLYREALIKLGSENEKEPEDIEVEMIANALLRARKGDYNFYRDVMDRMHGKAAQAIEISQKDNKPQLNEEQMRDLDKILNEYRANK